MATEQGLGRSDRYTLFLVTFVATVTAATQGYDSSMMNGLQILPGFEDYFNLSLPLQSLNVAMVSLGSVAASPFGAYVPDKYGRKWGMFLTGIIAIIGATIQSAAQNSAMFLIGRFLIGASVTLSCIVSPEYVAEVAHPKYRGPLTSLYGAFWYIGSILASVITFGAQYINSTWCWRLPSLLQFIPAIASILLLPFVPESPRWLLYKGRHEEALEILVKYHGGGDEDSPLVAAEYKEILETLEFEKATQTVGWKSLIASKGNRWRTGVCLTLAVFSEFSGANVVSYYIGTVLTTAGVSNTNTQLGINVGLSVWSLVCAVIGSVYVNKLSRRFEFLGSLGIMAITMVIMAALTKVYLGSDNAAASGAIVFLIFFFYIWQSAVWTPLSFVYIVEILSYSIRSSGLAAFQAACYMAGFINLFATPYAMDWSSWGFYLITALLCVLQAVAIFFYWPETRGLTLEEIDLVFDGKNHYENDVTVAEVEVVTVNAGVSKA